MNEKRPTAMKGTMKHAKTASSTEMFAGAIISVVQYSLPMFMLLIPLHCTAQPCASSEMQDTPCVWVCSLGDF
jgi:hypothetical protein